MYGCLSVRRRNGKKRARISKIWIEAGLSISTEAEGTLQPLMQWSGKVKSSSRGVACVIFDGDQSDPRCFSPAQYDTRIQALVEIMENKRKEAVSK